MRLSWDIFVLLVIVVAVESSTVLNAVKKFKKAKNNKCDGTSYKNDPALFPKLDGTFFKVYTSDASRTSAIVKLDQKGNGSINGTATDDGECCRTINIQSGEEYSTYDVINDADCSTELCDDSGQLKLIVSNEVDDAVCIILWSCRKAAKGVHALCEERLVSEEHTKWIREQFDKLNLTAYRLKQTTRYRKCFQK